MGLIRSSTSDLSGTRASSPYERNECFPSVTGAITHKEEGDRQMLNVDMTVQAILSSTGRDFFLPPYQRPYYSPDAPITTIFNVWKNIRRNHVPQTLYTYIENNHNMILGGEDWFVVLVIALAVLRREALKRGKLAVAGVITSTLNPGKPCYVPFEEDKWFIVDRCIRPEIDAIDLIMNDESQRVIIEALEGVEENRFSSTLRAYTADASGMTDDEVVQIAKKILQAKWDVKIFLNFPLSELLDVYKSVHLSFGN